MTKATPVKISGMLGNDSLTTNNVTANTTMEEININSLNNYEVLLVKKEDDFFQTIFPIFDAEKNVIVLVDAAHAERFREYNVLPETQNSPLLFRKYLF